MSREILTPQKTLEYILESFPDGIVGHDRERRIIYFNRAAEAITGWPRAKVLGKDCHQAFGAPFCGKNCSFCDGPPQERLALDYPLNIVTRGGEPKQLLMSVFSLTDAGGRVIGHTGAFRDVTSLVGLKVWEGGESFPGIVGRDPKMIRIFKKIYELANVDYPVCITGETGTGKELVAHAIHSESRRGAGPFIAVNCGALPEGLAESELFGHVKGAFTGAFRDKKGRFELAHKGAIFLDEVAELPKAMQAKLLRVLETGAFERVGGEKTMTADFRVISATNQDLRALVAQGRFREDLYYRLNVVPLHLPPLRERRHDIPLLIDYFLGQTAAAGRPAPRLSPEALALLKTYDWPGNVRELRSVIQYALAASDGALVWPEHLPPELRHVKPGRGPTPKLSQDAVQAALARCGGNKVKAARLLGVGRATLYRFLKDVS